MKNKIKDTLNNLEQKTKLIIKPINKINIGPITLLLNLSKLLIITSLIKNNDEIEIIIK